jgi:hypothetical protein
LPEEILPHARWYWYNPSYTLWRDITAYTRWDQNRAYIPLRDGGLGDCDGVANGVIHDPVGMALGLPVEAEAAGRCYIAAAAYGAAEHPRVQMLRDFRDTFLLTTPFGRIFVAGYERLSPGLANYVRTSGLIKGVVRTLADVTIYSILYPGIWVLIFGIMVGVILGCKFRLGRS